MALFKKVIKEPINYTNKTAAKIQQLRLIILVHSYIYYELDTNIISDEFWNKCANELYKLQSENEELAKQVIYHKEFIDFNPSTGFNLEYNQPQIVNIANRLIANNGGN